MPPSDSGTSSGNSAVGNDSAKNRTGLSFPLWLVESEDANGKVIRRLASCTYEEHIKQSIRALLLTGQRERVMRRDFGSRAGAYLYENIDVTTASLIQYEIKAAVERYEPRVELTDVKVKAGGKDLGVLNVEVSYRILSTDTADQFTTEVRR
jgi:phage baseplate assembly protein W